MYSIRGIEAFLEVTHCISTRKEIVRSST